MFAKGSDRYITSPITKKGFENYNSTSSPSPYHSTRRTQSLTTRFDKSPYSETYNLFSSRLDSQRPGITDRSSKFLYQTHKHARSLSQYAIRKDDPNPTYNSSSNIARKYPRNRSSYDSASTVDTKFDSGQYLFPRDSNPHQTTSPGQNYNNSSSYYRTSQKPIGLQAPPKLVNRYSPKLSSYSSLPFTSIQNPLDSEIDLKKSEVSIKGYSSNQEHLEEDKLRKESQYASLGHYQEEIPIKLASTHYIQEQISPVNAQQNAIKQEEITSDTKIFMPEVKFNNQDFAANYTPLSSRMPHRMKDFKYDYKYNRRRSICVSELRQRNTVYLPGHFSNFDHTIRIPTFESPAGISIPRVRIPYRVAYVPRVYFYPRVYYERYVPIYERRAMLIPRSFSPENSYKEFQNYYPMHTCAENQSIYENQTHADVMPSTYLNYDSVANLPVNFNQLSQATKDCLRRIGIIKTSTNNSLIRSSSSSNISNKPGMIPPTFTKSQNSGEKEILIINPKSDSAHEKEVFKITEKNLARSDVLSNGGNPQNDGSQIKVIEYYTSMKNFALSNASSQVSSQEYKLGSALKKITDSIDEMKKTL